MICSLCPRQCGADRNNTIGQCHADSRIRVARAALHFWEEPCISGKNGSGTVFFSGCALGCVFCQNKEISRLASGQILSQDELYDIFLRLENEGAHNINLVTADHYIPQIIPVIQRAKNNGFVLPFVLNTSSFLTEKAVDALSGNIDIYLADFKFMSKAVAKKYANAENYPDIAKKAISKMVSQVGAAEFKNGIMTRGVIVRALVLPDNIIDAKAIIKYLYDAFGDKIYISIMSQYTPTGDSEYPELCRTLTDREYKSVIDYAAQKGIKNAFCQEPSSADKSFIPEF